MRKCNNEVYQLAKDHALVKKQRFRPFCFCLPGVMFVTRGSKNGSQYVGESVQPFNKIMNGHRSDLTKKTLLHVS
jgi:hypothetical protein